MDPSQTRIRFESCPLCGGADSTEEMISNCSGHPSYRPPLEPSMRWLRCRQCDHIYVDGYFSTQALSILFANSLPHQSPGDNIENARQVSARIVDNVCAMQSKPGGRWLDIGFGSGALMTTAAEFGFEAIGIDLRAAGVEKMRRFGYEAHVIEFEDYRPAAPLEVISMADVLEHMPFPKRALEHARSLLSAGGLLFLSMPNSDSFLWKVMTANGVNPYWGEIEHYHNFGRRRLYALLSECGIEPLRYGISHRYRACMEVIARKEGVRSE